MNPLFRQEALDAKGDSLLGGIRICRRIDFSLATITTLALAAGLLIFCTFAHVTRKAHAEGVLVPALGTLQVVSSGNGTIIEMHVREGQVVRQGDVVAVVGMDRSAGHGDTIELVLQNILNRTAALQEQRRGRIQLARQRDRVLTSRIHSVSMQVQQVTEEMRLAQQRVALAQKSVKRYEQLAGAGYMSGMLAQQKHEELLDVKTRLRNSERNRSEIESQLALLIAEQEQAQIQAEVDLSDVDRNIAVTAQERLETEARGRQVLTAARTGSISALNIKVGQFVKAGQTLAVILPSDGTGVIALEAHVFAPSRTTGFVRPGQIVLVRYAAFPYQKFGMAKGKVRQISSSPIAVQDLPAGQSQISFAGIRTNEPLYRIEIELDSQSISTYGTPQKLVSGMTLEADLIQDRRTIGELLFEPLFVANAKHTVF